jgi:hypothetical protein
MESTVLTKLDDKAIEKEVAAILAQKPEETKRMRIWLEEKIAEGKKKNGHSEIVTLTPVLAQLLLERNPKNRPLSRRNQDELRQDFTSGRYVFNGESVIVSDTGILNDGQHRCLTVLETGIAIRTAIVFGPKEDTRFTVDTGKSKSVTNFLNMKGRTYTAVLAPTVNYVLQYRTKKKISPTGTNMPSKQAILEAADELDGVDTSVEFAFAATKTVRSVAVLAACHYIFWKKLKSRTLADEFIGKIINGEDIKKGDPILYCRNRLINMRNERADARIELIFKCWNAWRRNSGVDRYFKLTGHLPKLED